jgi:uncharacterized protein with von Willebrand factor type A (vWA) domain
MNWLKPEKGHPGFNRKTRVINSAARQFDKVIAFKESLVGVVQLIQRKSVTQGIFR